jgi:hypothetical protein
VTAARSIAGNRFGGDGGGQVIHHRPLAGFRSRLRSALNNLEKGIRWCRQQKTGAQRQSVVRTTLTGADELYNGQAVRARLST